MTLHSTFIFFSFRSYHDILQEITIPAIYRLYGFALILFLKLCDFDVVLVYHNPSLKDKLKLLEQQVSKEVFDMFQTLAETLKYSELEKAFSDLESSHLRIVL